MIRSEKVTAKPNALTRWSVANNGTQWYAVSVFSGKETVAERHLQRQGFVSYVPRSEKTVRHARRLETRVAPYFPGYIFVAMDVALQRWRSVNGTFGVRSLVMQGDRPLPIPSGLVERFVALTDEDGILDISGSLGEMIGRLERLDPNGRARVLIAIMNGEIPVDLELKGLVAIT